MHNLFLSVVGVQMSIGDSISAWIEDLKGGDRAAVQPLWNRYFTRMVQLARQKLVGERCRTHVAEDVAVSAFASFCQAAEAGRFPELEERDSLWKLLFTITVQKAFAELRRQRAIKRGGGRVVGESALFSEDGAQDLIGMATIIGNEPTPELAAVMAEEFQMLLAKLQDEDLQAVAVAKMEGCTNDEIAQHMNCAKRTVERRLNLIRRIWRNEIIPS